MSDLVGNPEDRFSRVAAQIFTNFYFNATSSLSGPVDCTAMKSFTIPNLGLRIKNKWITDGLAEILSTFLLAVSLSVCLSVCLSVDR